MGAWKPPARLAVSEGGRLAGSTVKCGHCGKAVVLLSMEIVFLDGRKTMTVCRTCWREEYGSPSSEDSMQAARRAR